jgi:hypothetical protein
VYIRLIEGKHERRTVRLNDEVALKIGADEKLARPALEQPSVALYYGILLSATGKTKEAAPFIQIALTNGNPLPEEKQLLVEILK